MTSDVEKIVTDALARDYERLEREDVRRFIEGEGLPMPEGLIRFVPNSVNTGPPVITSGGTSLPVEQSDDQVNWHPVENASDITMRYVRARRA